MDSHANPLALARLQSCRVFYVTSATLTRVSLSFFIHLFFMHGPKPIFEAIGPTMSARELRGIPGPGGTAKYT